MVTRFCFGEVWQRPGLDRKTRSLITLSMLIGTGRFLQFGAHVRGALANGVTQEELRELVLHSQLYCGIPSAVEATIICEATFKVDAGAAPRFGPAPPTGLAGGGLTPLWRATILHPLQQY